jgi:hypothetical protein
MGEHLSLVLSVYVRPGGLGLPAAWQQVLQPSTLAGPARLPGSRFIGREATLPGIVPAGFRSSRALASRRRCPALLDLLQPPLPPSLVLFPAPGGPVPAGDDRQGVPVSRGEGPGRRLLPTPVQPCTKGPLSRRLSLGHWLPAPGQVEYEDVGQVPQPWLWGSLGRGDQGCLMLLAQA